MQRANLVPHLFRTEYSKITAVLCKRFGFAHVEIAEDIASESFLAALETWPYKGVPENPRAWLYTVAMNKAKNRIARDDTFRQNVRQHLIAEEATSIDLSETNIIDSQLRMMFAICNPIISDEAQIGLALRILCGFGIDEIANAFLSNKETINKRLFRAREKLRAEKVDLEFPPPAEIENRLDNVLRTLYLLFNEGYYSETDNVIVREDLCSESMRLMEVLLQSENTSSQKVHALYALMCFHASRLAARKNEFGQMILYDDQDMSQWNTQLIQKGAWHLHRASHGSALSKYHLEASIAYWHTVKEDTAEKWQNILKLYDHLLAMEPSPVVALNRIVALWKVNGSELAIQAASAIDIQKNHFYYALLGELHRHVNKEKAIAYLQKAISLAGTEAEKQALSLRLETLS